MGIKTSKNYITANAIEAIIQEPKRIAKEEQNFLEKSSYGKVPSYLNRVKDDIDNEKQIIESCVHKQQKSKDEKIVESQYVEMDERDRQELLNALKEKWDFVNSKYQKICHRVAIDSLGDINRKEEQEAELQQLEDDIEKLSKPGKLYITSS
jgi:hypothetical protein